MLDYALAISFVQPQIYFVHTVKNATENKTGNSFNSMLPVLYTGQNCKRSNQTFHVTLQ